MLILVGQTLHLSSNPGHHYCVCELYVQCLPLGLWTKKKKNLYSVLQVLFLLFLSLTKRQFFIFKRQFFTHHNESPLHLGIPQLQPFEPARTNPSLGDFEYLMLGFIKGLLIFSFVFLFFLSLSQLSKGETPSPARVTVVQLSNPCHVIVIQ